MRKQITSTLTALLCLQALTACGSSQPAVYETSDVQAMADAGAFSETLE